MSARRVTCFSLSVQHRPGVVAGLARALKQNDVDLTALWGFGMGPGQAQIICQPTDPAKFRKVASAAGWSVTEGVAFEIAGEDQVGALVDMLDRVAGAGLNLEAINAVAVAGQYGGCVWAQKGQETKLEKILGA
jgi:predicted amino acid-binding ACT domain protein